MDTSSGYWFFYGTATDHHYEPFSRFDSAQPTTWSWPCAGSEGRAEISAAQLGTPRDNIPLHTNHSWEHLDRQSMVSHTTTQSPLQIDTKPKPDPLDWGSDTSFQANNRYNIPAHQPSEKDTVDRLLENTKWLILHYEDVSGRLLTRPRQIIRGRPRGSVNKLPRRRAARTDYLKKAAHIRSEQQRRDVVNKGFEELKGLVPGLRGQSFSKSDTLHVVCDWIEEFSQVNEGLRAELEELDRNMRQPGI
ncbi:hypothetical protein ASPCAL14126 [Aspergillus calidoustus]|uniref:BHLH domain-containing protein n=1 Tax=Aspergillus calidoustus TaxID=454130 RepID=A0A0U5GGB9_ASPCI|nr:hypothetical protein ASPCAL14126 [Aspergillus calidoustus]